MALNSYNFKEVVVDDRSLDVLVLFYTKYCELCDELWDVYIKASEELKLNRHLLFTAIDMQENELDGLLDG